MNTPQQIQVPRVQEITGKPTREQVTADRDWQRNRKRFREDTAQAGGYGTHEAKEAWLRRIRQTRSF